MTNLTVKATAHCSQCGVTKDVLISLDYSPEQVRATSAQVVTEYQRFIEQHTSCKQQ